MSSKRSRKPPTKFEPWVPGDRHIPMAIRQNKSSKKKEKKLENQKYRESMKQKMAPDTQSKKTSEVKYTEKKSKKQ